MKPLRHTYGGELLQQIESLLPGCGQLLKGLVPLYQAFNLVDICTQIGRPHQRLLAGQPRLGHVGVATKLQHLQH